MIKLVDLLLENNKILIPRRIEARKEQLNQQIQQKIQQYIENGSKGSLDLSDTQIKTLPNDLNVEGYLDLSDTQIQTLPNNLKVGGDLDLRNTPMSKKYTKIQIKQMCPEVKGNIYL